MLQISKIEPGRCKHLAVNTITSYMKNIITIQYTMNISDNYIIIGFWGDPDNCWQ